MATKIKLLNQLGDDRKLLLHATRNQLNKKMGGQMPRRQPKLQESITSRYTNTRYTQYMRVVRWETNVRN